MTISEIKEYARKEMRHIRTGIKDEFKEEHYNILIYKICELLDELEPKAKWTNNMNGTFTCSRCGAKRPNDNYCGNCGAIMREPKENKV